MNGDHREHPDATVAEQRLILAVLSLGVRLRVAHQHTARAPPAASWLCLRGQVQHRRLKRPRAGKRLGLRRHHGHAALSHLHNPRRTVMRTLILVVIVTAGPPGTDGGPAGRGCRAVNNYATYVGATRVSCSIVRTVAAGSVRGKRFDRWRCTGVGTGFGHCHGRGIRRGGIVHWAVND
jgi:hypothetical protein